MQHKTAILRKKDGDYTDKAARFSILSAGLGECGGFVRANLRKKGVKIAKKACLVASVSVYLRAF